jgi:curved DNA-binding protein CbpA
MSGIKELITSAFGQDACLYQDVLQCSPTATVSELRKAYHKNALCYHPDKQKARTEQGKEDMEGSTRATTLRFQAVSAAFELLSDPLKRALYDATKRISPEDDEVFGTATSRSSSGRRSSRNNNDKDWVEFFQSVFQEVATAGSDFDRDYYCGSHEETQDIIKYYKLCRGDLMKVLSCVVQGKEADFLRWKKDIIDPAIQRGEIESFERKRAHKLSHVGIEQGGKKIQRLRKKGTNQKITKQLADPTGLEDTDEEDDTASAAATARTNKSNSSKMTKRDKMEFRVAKKQKEKREKEIEFATMMQSKQWTSASMNDATSKQSKSPHRANKHGFSDSFLSRLEKKFSEEDNSYSAKKGKREKRKRHY